MKLVHHFTICGLSYGGKGSPGFKKGLWRMEGKAVPKGVYASWLQSPTRSPRSHEESNGAEEKFLVASLILLSLSTDAKNFVSKGAGSTLFFSGTSVRCPGRNFGTCATPHAFCEAGVIGPRMTTGRRQLHCLSLFACFRSW